MTGVVPEIIRSIRPVTGAVPENPERKPVTGENTSKSEYNTGDKEYVAEKIL